MWANLRFYLAGLLMCIGCIIPAAMFSLPEESIGILGAMVVFFAGGGLVYMIFNLYFQNENGTWKNNHEIIAKIISIVTGVLGIGLFVLINALYRGSYFAAYDLLIKPGADVTPILLRILYMILMGISAYSLYNNFLKEVDMSVHKYVRTTYDSMGNVIGTRDVAHRELGSVLSYFFLTILMGIFGIMCSSLPMAIGVLVINIIGLFKKNKTKKILLTIGIIVFILGVLFLLFLCYKNPINSEKIIYVTIQLMPVIFGLLVKIYYELFSRVEFFSNFIFTIIFAFVLVFIAYFTSYFLSLGLSHLFNLLIGLGL